jgi:hypothetical protein
MCAMRADADPTELIVYFGGEFTVARGAGGSLTHAPHYGKARCSTGIAPFVCWDNVAL